jgi:outer membrane PBP1 activator LpoA protein
MGNASSDNSRLYAFGGDAYRLSQQLAQLGDTPSAGIPGATGELYLSQQRVHRQLAWAQFRDGVAVPIN